MGRMRTVWFIAVLLAGCTTPAEEPPWHGRDLSADDPSWRSTMLQPRTSLELDLDRAPGDVIEWDWFIDEQMVVYFEVHAHHGVDHRYYARTYGEQNVSSAVVEVEGRHSILWSNPHIEALTLWYRVPEDARRAT